MLSPKKPRILLLPEEQRMIDMLGMSPAEYRWYCRETQKMMRLKPGEPVAFDLTFFAITLVVGIALNYAASLLAPRQQQQNDPARLEPRRVDGQDIVNASRFTSRSSFSGIQNVVELNSPIPIVYANRENKPTDGIWYGGVRVNTNLIWSQLWSVGGSQLFRGIFLVSESSVAIDPFQTAMGDNLFGSYELKPADDTNDYGRVSLYFNPDGGAITDNDYAAGCWWADDSGNSSPGGGEVFLTYDIFTDTNVRKFSYTFKPQTQTQFGLYAPLGVGLGYRVNPRFSPAVTPSLVPQGTEGDSQVLCSYDTQRIAERDVQGNVFCGRTGLTSSSGDSVSVGDTLTYTLYRQSDFGGSHTVPAPSPPVVGGEGRVSFDAAAQSVAGRQRSYDDALIKGETYKVGEAIAVCVSRSPDPFVSDADATTGNSVTATLKVIEGGQIKTYSENENLPGTPSNTRGSGENGTNNSHMFRCAISTFVVDRPCKQLEIGFRSTVGISYSGMVDWASCKPYENGVPDGSEGDNIDWLACFFYNNQTIASGEIFAPQQYNSGTYTGPDTRYSFFSIEYRVASKNESWSRIRRTFGVRSNTREPTYNYLTLGMPSEERWEFRIVPITGWQIRNDHGVDGLSVLDSKLSSVQRFLEGTSNVLLRYNGELNVPRSEDTFMLRVTQPGVANDLGLLVSDKFQSYEGYVDAWGKVAELFWYEEVQSSVGGTPEHEVSYVNIIQENPPSGAPTWADMSLLGMNLRASTESNELGQISVYCTDGVITEADPENGHLFPNVLRDLFLNPRYGAGEVMSAELIDEPSFQNAAAWTDKQRYYFDAGLSQVLNLVSQGNEWAQYFLLDLGKSGGKFTLTPTANFADDGAHPIEAMFTSGNTFSLETTSAEQQDRVPPIVVVKWRFEQQVQNEDFTGDDGTGIFPVIRSVVVREASTPADAPIIEADLTEFCTSEYQALDYAKMVCRKTRLQNYAVSLKTYPDVQAASPGAVIKVSSETVVYEQPQNGVVLNDGRIITTNSVLLDGDYDVVIWEGTGTSIRNVTLTILNGIAQGYTNAVFTIAGSNLFSDTFKVQAVDFDEDGNVDIQAVVFPLDANGFSELTKNWEDPGSWVIEGAGAFPDRPEPQPTFTAVTIVGPATGIRQTEYSFTAVPTGPANATYTYSWSATTGTLGSPTAATTTFSGDITGDVTLSVTVTEDGTGAEQSDTQIITLGEAPLTGVIINGTSTPSEGLTYPYTALPQGPDYSTYQFAWTTEVGTITSGTNVETITIDYTGVPSGTTGLIRCDVTQVANSLTVGGTLSVSVTIAPSLTINGPTAVGIGTSQYSVVLEGADPATTTWFWEEV